MTSKSRATFFLLAVALMTPALGSCSSSGGNIRTVEVDYRSDDFAGTFRGYYPRNVTVKPGMTVRFHQTWTGEPHTVTFGTEVQKIVEPKLLPIIKKYVPREPPEDAPEIEATGAQADAERLNTLPFFFGEGGPNPAAAQPCYLQKGLPKDEKPCPKRAQPEFSGTEGYYSSGFIPYLGERGNEFEMKIADDAEAGAYFYYCSLHGAAMFGEVTVTKSGQVPSQAEVNRAARNEAKAVSDPLLEQLEKERAGKGEFKGNLAGSGTEATASLLGQVNEFTPRTVEAKVGEPVSWTFVGTHTISFNVPKYVPYYDVSKSGRVIASEKIYQPAGGWPGRNPPTESDGPDTAQALPAVEVDAGKFAGAGRLKSSGIDWQTGDKYRVTFTKSGTYPMACLVHPGMIGKVVVS